jgi:hypothetical protein
MVLQALLMADVIDGQGIIIQLWRLRSQDLIRFYSIRDAGLYTGRSVSRVHAVMVCEHCDGKSGSTSTPHERASTVLCLAYAPSR